MAPRHAHPASMPASVPEVPLIYPDTPTGRRAETARQARRSERFAQYTQVVALRDQGLDQPTIACLVGISARTVSRWLAVDGFPERKPRSGEASCLDPYKPVLPGERCRIGGSRSLSRFGRDFCETGTWSGDWKDDRSAALSRRQCWRLPPASLVHRHIRPPALPPA